MKLDVNLNGPWKLCGRSDTDHAGDNDTHNSVTGYIILINGSFITCCSKNQKTVTLYVIEA